MLGPIGGIVRDVTAVVRAIPGVGLAERRLRGVERAALRELSARIEDATGEPAVAASADGRGAAPATPPERLEALLQRSRDQTPTESHGALVDVVLREIVPDEARILAALSDGSVYPVVHVNAGGVARGRRILSNASSVGRAAGVALPDRVPAYLTRLRHLGLVEIGPADPSKEDEYEILLTDATVRRARAAADSDRVRFDRRTVRMTEVGAEVWRSCRPV